MGTNENFSKNFKRIVRKDHNKLSGVKKDRVCFDPSPEARKINDKIAANLRQTFYNKLYSKSGGFNVSVVNNLLDHRKRGLQSKRYYFPRHFYCVDIKNAFVSVSFEKFIETEIYQKWVESLYSFEKEMPEQLKEYCFLPDKSGLIVGAPASPIMFYFYCKELIDEDLYKLLESTGIKYTRYADDLVFSSNVKFSNSFRSSILNIIRKAGFEINHKKTKVFDLAKGPICINGIMVENRNNEARLFIPRSHMTRLYGLIWTALHKDNVKISPQKIGGEMNTFIKIMKEFHWDLTETEKDLVKIYSSYKFKFFPPRLRVKGSHRKRRLVDNLPF
jgi:hypothetical protein